MKALSIHAPYVYDILTGNKKEEFRTWKPKNGGRILICSSAKIYKGFASGYALATAEIGRIADYSDEMEDGRPMFGWQLKRLQYVEPFALKGKLHLFEVADDLIKPLPGISMQEYIETYYDPLRKW